jgi:integrase
MEVASRGLKQKPLIANWQRLAFGLAFLFQEKLTMGIYRHEGKTKVTYQWKFQFNGKTHTGTFKTDSKKEATALFILKQREIESGQLTEAGAEPAKLFSAFIDECRSGCPLNEHRHIFKALKGYFAGKHLHEISKRDVIAFRDWRLSVRVEPRKPGGKTWARSPRTVNREFSILSGLLQKAVEKFLLSANPCHGIPSLPFVAPQPQIWTREEAMRAISNMVGEREHLLPLVVVALQTGLSRKDLFQLRRGEVQISTERRVIRKVRAKTKVALNIPLNSIACSVLEPLIRGKRDQDFVFVNPQTGKPYITITHSLDTVCRLAGVPRMTWHKFRHCVGTWLAEDGAGIEVIARFLGHSDYRTAPVYVQLAADRIRPQAEQLGAWLNNVPGIPSFPNGLKAEFPELRLAS